jgi:hypothetical protein
VASSPTAHDVLSLGVISELAGSQPETSITIRVAALDVTADPVFLASLVLFFQLETASRSTYTPSPSARAAEEVETSSVIGLKRHERLLLDVKMAAPVIYLLSLSEDGGQGHATFHGNVLVFRLGFLTIENIHAPQGDDTSAFEFNHANAYSLKVEGMSVDLLRGAELSGAEIFSDNSVSILGDTSFVSTISSSLALASTLPDAFTVHATLAEITICADVDAVCEVAQIAGSWINKNSQTKMSVERWHEAPIVAGRVLVRGLASQSGWVWRWIQVHARSIEVKRCELDEVVEQTVLLDNVQASTEVFAGERVIVLQSLECLSALDEKRVLVYVGGAGERGRWLDDIWTAQKAINPARDWSAPMVFPEAVLYDPTLSPHTPTGLPPDYRGRSRTAVLESERPNYIPGDKQATKFTMKKSRQKKRGPPRVHVRFKNEMLKMALTDEHEVTVIDLTLRNLILSSESETKVCTTVEISAVVLGDAVHYNIFQPMGDNWGSKPCFRMNLETTETSESRMTIDLPLAFALNLDPTTASKVSKVFERISQSFLNQIIVSTRHQPGVRALHTVMLEKIPQSFYLQGSAGNIASKRITCSLNAVGMQVLLLDAKHEKSACLEMLNVSFSTEGLDDGSSTIGASLGSLHILDCLAPTSLYPTIVTISQSSDAFVHVHMQMFDHLSIGQAADSLNQVKIRIKRPQITLLLRPVNDLIAYLSELQTAVAGEGSSSTHTAAGPAANTAEPDSPALSRRGMRIKIDLVHPELRLPRNSCSQDAWILDFGSIHVDSCAQDYSISLTHARLDTVEALLGDVTTRTSSSIITDINGTAQVCLGGEGGLATEMTVDIELDALRGSLTDTQYALLMSILDENFNEQRVRDVSAAKSACAPCASDRTNFPQEEPASSQLTGSYNEMLKRWKCEAATRLPLQFYSVKIHGLELALNLHMNSEKDGKQGENDKALVLARAADVSIVYTTFIDENQQTPEFLRAEDTELVLAMILHLSRFEVIDTRFPSRVPKLLITSQTNGTTDAPPAVQYLVTTMGHSLLEVAPDFAELVSDIGLMTSLLTWSASRNRCYCGHPFGGHSCSENGFEYVRAPPISTPDGWKEWERRQKQGIFIIETAIPSSSIHLVAQLDDAESPGFDMNGSIFLTYTISQRQTSLRVQVPDLILKRRESEQQLAAVKSDAGIDMFICCGVEVSCKWYEAVDSADQLSVRLTDSLRGILTYEVVMLANRVCTSLMSSMDRQIETYIDMRHAADTKVIENPAQVSSDSESAEAQLVKSELEMSIVGNKIRLTIVDDFEGRWQPLLRLQVALLDLGGTNSELSVELAKGSIDYFHVPNSAWKAFLEESDLSMKYVNKFEKGQSSDFQLNIKANSDIMTHVSKEAISSFSLAAATWSKDQRSWEKEDYDQKRHFNVFVPYAIHNMLHETLVCVTEDGTEHRIESQQWIRLSYAQVWRKSPSTLAKLNEIRHDNELVGEGMQHQIELHVLQHSGSARKLGSVSIDIEQRGTLALYPEHAATCACEICTGVKPMIGYHVYGDTGQKCLRVYSMTSLRNCTSTPLRCVVFQDQEAAFETDVPANGRDVPIPLALSTGTVCLKPHTPEDGRGYEFCDLTSGSVSLQQIHDGSFRHTDLIDFRFQNAFGAELPPDTTLLKWYTCANDVPGKGMRVGVLYITNKYLCHKSDVMGKKSVVIPLSSITKLKKVNTALVIPNAIRVKTTTADYYFRTFTQRNLTFREIIKVLPNKDAVSPDDDIEATARTLFGLMEADVILFVYNGRWHHDPGSSVYTPTVGFAQKFKPRMPGFTDGKIFGTSQHLLFMADGDDGMLFNSNKVKSRHKIAWADVRGIEKRKSMVVMNNAVLISTTSESLFLSSTSWDRDEAIDKMSKLCSTPDAASSASEVDSAAGQADDEALAGVGSACRQVTCLRPLHPLSQLASTARHRTLEPTSKRKLADVLADAVEYKRYLGRAREAMSFNVLLVDAVTAGTFSNRKPGNPCVVEMHAPWIVENLTCLHLELQLVDKIRCVIETVILLPGDTCHVTAVDQRRKLCARARQLAGGMAGPWSNLAKIYSKAIGKYQDVTDVQLEVADVSEQGGCSQSVEVEVWTCRVCVFVCV